MLKIKSISLIQIFFSLALLGIILFELIYFLRLKPFFYPANFSANDFKISFTPENFFFSQAEKMPLKEKVGRLFIVGFSGKKLSSEQISFFKKNHFCNFIIGRQNIQDQDQLKTLVHSLTSLCKGRALRPIVVVDQEGGRVARINFGGINNVSQAEIKTASQAGRIAKNRGEILKNLGFNLNLAPVLEVQRQPDSYIGQRAFLGGENQVYLLAKAMIAGYQQASIIAAAKHFPGGLGRTNLDPHFVLPIIRVNLDEMAQDLYPYQRLINDQSLKAVMVGHLKYPQIDQNYPASLSKTFISQILRQELGFKGLVITDDLSMKAINNYYQASSAAKLAFKAGADLILISGSKTSQEQAFQALFQLVLKGEVKKKRVEQSLKRIMISFFN